MNMGIRIRLSVMMFLQFFIWGAWFVTLGTYLGSINFSGTQIGWVYTTTGWAAIISPLFVGMIADRFFPGEKVLAAMHFLGAILMYLASTQTSFIPFFVLLLAYTMCYMPTLALVNAVSFSQMSDVEKQFGGIRVFGTLGWIVAGIIISRMGVESSVTPMYLAAGLSVLMGIYSLFFLPSTPPKGAGKQVNVSDLLGLEAITLMKRPAFAVFTISSLLICIPLAFYYTFTNPFLNEIGMEKAAEKMTMGQMSEVGFMLIMPFLLVRLGVKWMLIIGMLAWVARYVLFAYGNVDSAVWMLYGGILLHGICYDFFFMTGHIYVDEAAPREIRASAQGFIALVTYGIGMLIGNFVCGPIVDMFSKTESDGTVLHNWNQIWLVPAAMAFAVTVVFALTFWDKRKPNVESAA
ncbi:MAG: xanthosine permease [Candidatus Hydrogenedentota bacterium]